MTDKLKTRLDLNDVEVGDIWDFDGTTIIVIDVDKLNITWNFYVYRMRSSRGYTNEYLTGMDIRHINPHTRTPLWKALNSPERSEDG